ncbi:MAG: hypothetical protein R2867_15345 [Caldilineaceae bacterium]
MPQRFGFSEELIERRTINFKMFNSFRDGTKANVEMTALANAAGLVPDVRGMHEPAVNIEEIAQTFSLQDEGGILRQHGVVELANSVAPDGKSLLPNALKMGVFCVIRTDHPFIQEDLQGYYVAPGGNGNNYVLWRPYHLVAVEAPISIMNAVFYGMATGSPLPTPTAECVTIAKRNVEEGEILDGGGGYTVLGHAEKATVAREQGLLPWASARAHGSKSMWQPVNRLPMIWLSCRPIRLSGSCARCRMRRFGNQKGGVPWHPALLITNYWLVYRATVGR